MGPDVLAGILPLLYREVLDEAYAHQDAGRPAYIVTAASQELAEVLAHVLVLDGGIGHAKRGARRRLHRAGRRPVHLSRGEGRGDPPARRRGGHRPPESYAYSDSSPTSLMMRTWGTRWP